MEKFEILNSFILICIYSKRLNNEPLFLYACTLFMYEIHACKKGGLLFRRLW